MAVGMAEFKCDQCGKVFNNENSLRQHANDKHVEKPAEQRPGPKPAPPAETHDTGPRKVKMSIGKGTIYAIITVVIVAAGGYGAYAYFSGQPADSGASALAQPIGPLGSTHIHADFAVFLDGEELTPLDASYFVRNRFVHVESGAGAGTVMHIHATNVPLGFFFRSLGMTFNSECFRLDNGLEYCNEGNKTLKMFVRGFNGEWEENRQFHTYVFRDLDQILITYGDETAEEIAQQQDSVTSFSSANSGRNMDLRNLPR